MGWEHYERTGSFTYRCRECGAERACGAMMHVQRFIEQHDKEHSR